jgi:hypothetical protein
LFFGDAERVRRMTAPAWRRAQDTSPHPGVSWRPPPRGWPRERLIPA